MEIYERFIDLISFDTQSNPESDTYPSSITEIEFAKKLVSILKEEGVKDVELDEFGLVYARVENGSKETIGLISHMDTAPDLIGGIKNPRLIEKYDGNPIKLDETYTMKSEDFPWLNTLVGEDIVVTDGKHLLGGDDKAGITIILEFLKRYIKNKDKYNFNLAICFTPDEEIGKGPLHFDVKKMNATIAYTLDGGPIHEANYENFNAAHATLSIKGVGVHPGSATGIMINAALLGNEFISLLPPKMTPRDTKEREGFIHLTGFMGDVEEAKLSFILRDHDLTLLNKQKEILESAKKEIEKRYPKATLSLEIEDDYRNMFDYFKKDLRAIELINNAYLKLKEKLVYTPIRGGTDGATITYMGLACPNLGVGNYSPHGRFEVISLTQMKRMVDIVETMFTLSL